MTAFIAWLLSNPTVAMLGAGIVAAVLAIWRTFALGRAHGRNEQKAKEADSYEQSLKDLADAANARASVRPDSVQHDPYRRD